jgi:hypothetical protein
MPAVLATVIAALPGGGARAQRDVVAPSATPIDRSTPWVARIDAWPKAADAIREVAFGEVDLQLTARIDGGQRTWRPGTPSYEPGRITAACTPGQPTEWDAWAAASNALPPGKRQFATLTLTKTLDGKSLDQFARRVTARIAPVGVQRADDKAGCAETVVFAVESMTLEGANTAGPLTLPGSAGGVAVELETCAGCGETSTDYGLIVVAGGGRARVRRTLTYGADQDPKLSPVADFDAVEPLWLRGIATHERGPILEWVNESLAGNATARALYVDRLDYDERRDTVRARREQGFGGVLPKRLFLQPIPVGVSDVACGAHCAELDYLEVQPTTAD